MAITAELFHGGHLYLLFKQTFLIIWMGDYIVGDLSRYSLGCLLLNALVFLGVLERMHFWTKTHKFLYCYTLHLIFHLAQDLLVDVAVQGMVFRIF